MSINIRINGKEAYILNEATLKNYYNLYRNDGFFKALLTHPGLDAFEKEINYGNYKVETEEYIKNKSVDDTIAALNITENDSTYEWLDGFLHNCYSLVIDEAGADFLCKVVKWYFLITAFKNRMTKAEEDYVTGQLGFTKDVFECVDNNVYVSGGDVYFRSKAGKVFCNNSLKAQGIKCFSYGSQTNIIYLKNDGTLDENLTETVPLNLWNAGGKPKLKQVSAFGEDFLLLTEDGRIFENEAYRYCDLGGISAVWIDVGLNTRNIIDVNSRLHSNIPAINSLNLENIKTAQSELKQLTDGKWVCNWFAISKDGCMYYAHETTPDKENMAICNTINDGVINAKIYNGNIYYIKYGSDNLFKLDIVTGESADTKTKINENEDFYVVNNGICKVKL